MRVNSISKTVLVPSVNQQIWLLVTILLLNHIPALANSQTLLEDQIVGVQIGASVATLQSLYPGLYKHKLVLGEFLYEACNQNNLDVFTFTEESWSPGYITYVGIRRETDVSVCRDKTGALPDLSITAATPRGLSLTDSKTAVLARYGVPFEEKNIPNGRTLLSYKRSDTAGLLVEHLTLIITLEKDRVISFSLGGDIPGVKKPF